MGFRLYGDLIEVGFQQPAQLEEIRAALEAKGFGDATVPTLVAHVM